MTVSHIDTHFKGIDFKQLPEHILDKIGSLLQLEKEATCVRAGCTKKTFEQLQSKE